VTSKYAKKLENIGKGKWKDNWKSYKKLFCKSFLVVDPVGTDKITCKQNLKKAFKDSDEEKPKGFSLTVKATSIAQDYQHAAVFSTMAVPTANGTDELVNRTDFMMIKTRKKKNKNKKKIKL